MTAVEFKSWRLRMPLSLAGAAAALDVSVSQVKRMQNGTRRVWGPVAKLCSYLEREASDSARSAKIASR